MKIDITQKMNRSEKEIFQRYSSHYPFQIVEFIKDLGIKMYSATMDAGLSGAICKEDNEYAIYITDSDSAVRARFTLAHELGHYFYDRDYLDEKKTILDSSKQVVRKLLFRKQKFHDDPEMRKRDVRANQFAAELLMPEKKFIEVWQQETTPESVAKFFYVSVDATKVRAASLLGVMA